MDRRGQSEKLPEEIEGLLGWVGVTQVTIVQAIVDAELWRGGSA
ncbi:hypothetical protein [Chelatococcus asaccharovorans]|nr:hypothetical protein [Chelatococcus asaccharovorans]